MNILGISAFYHDSACCLLQRGKLVAAASEERFTRVRNDRRIPLNAYRFCLEAGGLIPSEIDAIAYYESPEKKLSRQLSQFFARPRLDPGTDTSWLDPRKPERELREKLGFDGEILVFEHHQCHAASAFYYSGFREAAIMTVDGVGEWATTTYGFGRASALETLEEVRFPDSLGLFYSALTDFLGFSVLSDEYKVMGLAPYGQPTFLTEIRELIESTAGGGFRLNRKYFDFNGGDRMHTEALSELLRTQPRVPESELLPVHQDIARSVQVVLEEILLEKARYLFDRTGTPNLCLAGGVALNCVANRRLRAEGPFRELFVQPASGDAGGALGAAALAHTRMGGQRHSESALSHACLGPEYPTEAIASLLRQSSIAFTDFRSRENALLEEVADRLARGEVIGWFHGRMEFGPRALGARSILADPRDPTMRDRLNQLVKKREAFRPFAPVILEARMSEHLALERPAPFMTETCQVRSKLDLPAITHVDGSARPQTVSPATHPRLARLLEHFEHRTGCPMLVNTSFNVRGEPIVCSPEDALRCLAGTKIDCLVLEDFLVDRNGVPGFLRKAFQSQAASGFEGACHQPDSRLTGWPERWRPADGALPAGVYTFF